MGDDNLAEQIAEKLAPLIEEIADDSEELFVAGAALVISVIALIATVLQVVQQYYASANGYSSCDEKVMKDWSQSRSRKFRPYDFRFEVQYDAPVIFLASSSYKTTGRGPVEGRPVVMLSGDPQSRADSWTEIGDEGGDDTERKSQKQMMKDRKGKDEAQKRAQKRAQKVAIHTADNELASWITLLYKIQYMETKSRTWQREWFEKSPPRPPTSSSDVQKPARIEAVEDDHTIAVYMQKKTKSWDTMPANVHKPYATTTWCHMIELTALLGIYWVEFNRTNDRYRAEGNGLTVLGEKVSDLGVMFSFHVSGETRFEENRVIPSDAIKDLAFGIVSTVFSRPGARDHRRLNKNDRQDLSTLCFASRAEVAEALMLIGCNTHTVNYFTRDDNSHKRTTHIFPVTFEIIGMLAKTHHIKGSGFRFLPNPTLDQWNSKNFSLREILHGFLRQVEPGQSLENPNTKIIKALRAHGTRIWGTMMQEDTPGWPSFGILNALHQALDVTDFILTGTRPPESRLPRNDTRYSTSVQNQGGRKQPVKQGKIATETPEEQARRELVQEVLRSHIQEVLFSLNEASQQESKDTPQSATSPTLRIPSTDLGLGQTALPSFSDIDSATPEDKQAKLMEVYFKVIRAKVLRVLEGVEKSKVKRRESVASSVAGQSAAPPIYGTVKKRMTERTTASESVAEEAVEEGGWEQEEIGDSSEDGSAGDGGGLSSDSDGIDSVSNVDSDLWLVQASYEDVWCTLVFRMICWLMLHDFDKKDQQISQSELHGSRLSIYIS